MSAPPIPAATAQLLSSPGAARLWEKARARLEANGMAAQGIVELRDLSDAERDTISGLLGRPVTGDRARVDLALLDSRLRASPAGRSLAAVLETLGPPLRDRKAARHAAEAARVSLWTSARDALHAEGLAACEWAEPWLAGLRSSGLLSRLPPDEAVATVTKALRCLALVPGLDPAAAPAATMARNDLAAKAALSAHSLDDGTVLSVAVLRAVAVARGVDVPATAGGRRALWASVGVIVDEVSTTVLTLGLAPSGGHSRNAELRATAADSVETHLNARDLRRIEWNLAPATLVSICENPRVVEAAADAGVRVPLVCTFGNPTSVVTALLGLLADAGAKFRYHGDFDWPGIAIANRVVAQVAATSWRMGADDYRAAISAYGGELPALEGASVPAVWDPELGEAMADAGRAVHEELLLDSLIIDLM